jgi:hypothetical protein
MRHKRARALAASSVVLAALTMPASAMAAISPGKSIGKVVVRQSESEARAAVGKPTQRTCFRDGNGSQDYKACILTWKHRKLSAYLIDGKVAQVATTGTTERTSRGIGVGDKRSALDKAYPACKDVTRAYCILGSTRRTGDRYTFVHLTGSRAGARIDRIAVGRWDTRFECALGCG